MKEQKNLRKKIHSKTQKMASDPFLEAKGDKLDLGVGNPAFMFEYWTLVKNLTEGAGQTKISIDKYMSYDYAQSNSELKLSIKELHKKYKNASTDGKHIVFGNGASQLISAAGYAARTLYSEDFYTQQPYWPRIPTLLAYGASAYNDQEKSPRSTIVWAENHGHQTISFTTSPNNPNSVESVADETTSVFKIYDLCYNWPQYTAPKTYDGDVLIFGLGKATGHAGSRIGWAIVKDKKIADSMTKYIELSTSGVSQDAQARALTVLKTLEELEKVQFTSVFDAAKSELSRRWGLLKAVTDTKTEEFRVLNNSGMFAWCEWADKNKDGAKEFGEKYKVQVIGGEAFGAKKHNFRVSIGCYKADFDRLLETLVANA